jgi:hypothetical protein
MRPPRFQFPNEVRSITRTIASAMVGNGNVAETPEQLDTWIGQRPDVRESLRADGYGTDFSAEDLFPLLQVFVGQAGGAAPEPAARPRASHRRWVLPALLLVMVITVVVLALMMAPRSR